MDESHLSKPRDATLWFGIVLEGALVFCAIGLSFVGLYDPRQSLRNFGWQEIGDGLIWGSLASLPLLGYLIAFHLFPRKWMRSLRQFCHDHLRPLFQASAIWELALLSIAAGIGEELLFRWCFQGGISEILDPRVGQPAAGIIGLISASLLFGVCHAVTKLYFLVTFLGGLFLGWTMMVSQNWFVPAVAHALYDFLALIYIAKIMDDTDSVEAES